VRADLIKYAGASGDFNIIHWNERVALEVGLPSVIAHGMLTMGTVIRVVTDWLGDPGKVIDYSARFTVQFRSLIRMKARASRFPRKLQSYSKMIGP